MPESLDVARPCKPDRSKRNVYLRHPGWSRAFALSSKLAAKRIIQNLDCTPNTINWVIYTVPQYAHVAELVAAHPGREKVRQAYYAFDWYQGYAWDATAVKRLEGRLFKTCDRIIAVSKRLADDFAAASGRACRYLPNAVSETFLAAAASGLPRPADIPAAPPGGLLVGCTGQMNNSYDWDLIESLAKARPEDLFVFVGEIQEAQPAALNRMDRVLQLPNVRAIGPRPHQTLPAYLQSFDVCLNPLKITPFNDRRSPLRLYDYLTTGKPIISTAVSEAYCHSPHITIVDGAPAAAAALAAIQRGQHAVAVNERRAYIQSNTWPVRASQLVSILQGQKEE